MADKVVDALIEALRQLLAGPAEQRLYRSGKLAGVFASRVGAGGEAAGRAIREGLLEVVRTEVRGKTEIEWVRLTPAGVEFLHGNDSPIRVLEELRDLLRTTNDGMPTWLAQLQTELRAAGAKLSEETQRMNRRLESLSERVEAALRRADLELMPAPNGAAVSWARDALAYLERRRQEGAAQPCALPELFAAIKPRNAELSLPGFLDGLRRLHDHRAVQLLPFTEAVDRIPEPEFALADGSALFYYVTR